jgi:hypothetical protein
MHLNGKGGRWMTFITKLKQFWKAFELKEPLLKSAIIEADKIYHDEGYYSYEFKSRRIDPLIDELHELLKDLFNEETVSYERY